MTFLSKKKQNIYKNNLREPSFNEFVKDVLIILSFAAKAFFTEWYKGGGGKSTKNWRRKKGKMKMELHAFTEP